MKRPVIWAPSARRELTEIIRYIKLDNADAAAKVSRELRAAAARLGDAMTGRPGRVDGTYEKSVARLPYILAYEVLAQGTGEVIAILHVIHTARNWPAGRWPEDVRSEP